MECKFYNKHLDTIREMIGCLYSLNGCGAGGMLHILLDDDNIDDDDITWCLKECLKHPEKEESCLGKLICEEYLKLSMEERRLLTGTYIGHWSCPFVSEEQNCSECEIVKGFDYEDPEW